jgi:hypothetical protein
LKPDETRGEVPPRLKLLEPYGVHVHHDYVYEGEGADRHRVDLLDTVYSVLIPFTPLEWCLTAMREPPPCPEEGLEYESYYVGPCCGITGAIQDIWNSIFRDSGWVDAPDFLRIGELARQHEGFETFQPLSDEQFEELLGQWDRGDLDPWAKTGIVFNAVEPYLKPRRHENPSMDTRCDEEAKLIYQLESALRSLHWSDLMSPSGHQMIDDIHEAQREIDRAKVGPLAKRLTELLGDIDFKGYAITDAEGKEPMANGYGQCVYKDRESAERIIELWAREDGEQPKEARIVPAMVIDGELVLDAS